MNKENVIKELIENKNYRSNLNEILHRYFNENEDSYKEWGKYLKYFSENESMSGKEVINELNNSDDILLPVMVCDVLTGNEYPIICIDNQNDNAIKLAINTEDRMPFCEDFMVTYYEMVLHVDNMNLDADKRYKFCYECTWEFVKKYQDYAFDGDFDDKLEEFLDNKIK